MEENVLGVFHCYRGTLLIVLGVEEENVEVQGLEEKNVGVETGHAMEENHVEVEVQGLKLFQLNGEEDDGEKEVGTSSRRQKNRRGVLEYNREVHLKNHVLVPNMVFGTDVDFRQLVMEYEVTSKKPLKFVKNEEMRVCVKCIQEDCDFFVLCSQVGKSKDLSINTMDRNHTCGTSMKIPIISVKSLAKKYVNKAVVEVENTDSWTWFVQLLKEDLMIDSEPDSWILMTDQQKGLEIVIQNELPAIEHRLCVKHLHANWSKIFPWKVLKKMMWKCAMTANEPYFEVKMQQLKSVIVEGYKALQNIDPRKWTRYAFRPGRNCPKLVNNWDEAFKIFIITARD
ncbi:hypothetical protein LIER_09756 [Lithospermum erythrorhizon]|uniref:MULE transposase domain-containing protein n=1 Tax=Lithospermum erythrorhizon TaxID=34254 RepID=A0AAV3PH09_LITER